MLTTENGGALLGRVPDIKQYTMKIKILKDCVVAGVCVDAGTTVTVKIRDAKLLIGMKKAEAVAEGGISKAKGKRLVAEDPEGRLKSKISNR